MDDGIAEMTWREVRRHAAACGQACRHAGGSWDGRSFLRLLASAARGLWGVVLCILAVVLLMRAWYLHSAIFQLKTQLSSTGSNDLASSAEPAEAKWMKWTSPGIDLPQALAGLPEAVASVAHRTLYPLLGELVLRSPTSLETDLAFQLANWTESCVVALSNVRGNVSSQDVVQNHDFSSLYVWTGVYWADDTDPPVESVVVKPLAPGWLPKVLGVMLFVGQVSIDSRSLVARHCWGTLGNLQQSDPVLWSLSLQLLGVWFANSFCTDHADLVVADDNNQELLEAVTNSEIANADWQAIFRTEGLRSGKLLVVLMVRALFFAMAGRALLATQGFAFIVGQWKRAFQCMPNSKWAVAIPGNVVDTQCFDPFMICFPGIVIWACDWSSRMYSTALLDFVDPFLGVSWAAVGCTGIETACVTALTFGSLFLWALLLATGDIVSAVQTGTSERSWKAILEDARNFGENGATLTFIRSIWAWWLPWVLDFALEQLIASSFGGFLSNVALFVSSSAIYTHCNMIWNDTSVAIDVDGDSDHQEPENCYPHSHRKWTRSYERELWQKQQLEDEAHLERKPRKAARVQHNAPAGRVASDIRTPQLTSLDPGIPWRESILKIDSLNSKIDSLLASQQHNLQPDSRLSEPANRNARPESAEIVIGDGPDSCCLLPRSHTTWMIEDRGVSAAFLKQFTRFWITEEKETRAQADAIGFLTKKEKEAGLSMHEKADLARRQCSQPYMTARDVHRMIIKPETRVAMCRFSELPSIRHKTDAEGKPLIGRAKFFFSYSWDSPWSEVVGALISHSAKLVNVGSPAPYYWIDIFAVNQHERDDTAANGQPLCCACPGCRNTKLERLCTDCVRTSCNDCPGCASKAADMHDWDTADSNNPKGFARVISCTRHTLVLNEPWDNPRPPKRVWCLFEGYQTLMQPGGKLEVVLGPKQQVDLQLSLNKKAAVLENLVQSIDARTAEASVENDRQKIFSEIEKLPGGFEDFNVKLQQAQWRWLSDAASGVLHRTNPSRDPMRSSELVAEVETVGYVLAWCSAVLDAFPWLTFVIQLQSYALPAAAFLAIGLVWNGGWLYILLCSATVQGVLVLMSAATFCVLVAQLTYHYFDAHAVSLGMLLTASIFIAAALIAVFQPLISFSAELFFSRYGASSSQMHTKFVKLPIFMSVVWAKLVFLMLDKVAKYHLQRQLRLHCWNAVLLEWQVSSYYIPVGDWPIWDGDHLVQSVSVLWDYLVAQCSLSCSRPISLWMWVLVPAVLWAVCGWQMGIVSVTTLPMAFRALDCCAAESDVHPRTRAALAVKVGWLRLRLGQPNEAVEVFSQAQTELIDAVSRLPKPGSVAASVLKPDQLAGLELSKYAAAAGHVRALCDAKRADEALVIVDRLKLRLSALNVVSHGEASLFIAGLLAAALRPDIEVVSHLRTAVQSGCSIWPGTMNIWFRKPGTKKLETRLPEWSDFLKRMETHRASVHYNNAAANNAAAEFFELYPEFCFNKAKVVY